MRRRLYPAFFALALLFLWGCGKEAEPQTEILVNIREGQGFTVENNGQFIQPGEDAVFLLSMEEGLSVADTDHDGGHSAVMEGGRIKLTLKNVKCPSHVTLRLTDSYAAITYEPNGGIGQTTTGLSDTTNHLRPNTATGTDLFTRDGYTLAGWNTRADGMGQRIGLGSRVSVPEEGLTLYAQWAKWNDEQDFEWTVYEDGITVTGYHGNAQTVVIPATIDGKAVTAIAAGAFRDGTMGEVILPNTLTAVEDGAFQNCALATLTLFDNIESIGDGAFVDCAQLKTLRINAIEEPYGFDYRRESCYADKVDLLIHAQGEKKVVFYGGCSTWFNLDSAMLTPLLERGYRVVNMGLNGLASSSVQMQILGNYLEEGDILFHTPELSSAQQMMIDLTMEENGDKLWCGIEYNYDLFTLVDLRAVPGALDSLCAFLAQKKSGTDYTSVFMKNGNTYCDEYGCVPFYRGETMTALQDEVYMDPSYITDGGMARLKTVYDQYQARGVRIYVSYAAVNMDEVPEEQRDSVGMVEQRFQDAIEEMDGPVLISRLDDFLYRRDDFYDTNYHLLSEQARANTLIWLRDLQVQMERDGLWEAP